MPKKTKKEIMKENEERIAQLKLLVAEKKKQKSKEVLSGVFKGFTARQDVKAEKLRQEKEQLETLVKQKREIEESEEERNASRKITSNLKEEIFRKKKAKAQEKISKDRRLDKPISDHMRDYNLHISLKKKYIDKFNDKDFDKYPKIMEEFIKNPDYILKGEGEPYKKQKEVREGYNEWKKSMPSSKGEKQNKWTEDEHELNFIFDDEELTLPLYKNVKKIKQNYQEEQEKIENELSSLKKLERSDRKKYPNAGNTNPSTMNGLDYLYRLCQERNKDYLDFKFASLILTDEDYEKIVGGERDYNETPFRKGNEDALFHRALDKLYEVCQRQNIIYLNQKVMWQIDAYTIFLLSKKLKFNQEIWDKYIKIKMILEPIILGTNNLKTALDYIQDKYEEEDKDGIEKLRVLNRIYSRSKYKKIIGGEGGDDVEKFGIGWDLTYYDGRQGEFSALLIHDPPLENKIQNDISNTEYFSKFVDMFLESNGEEPIKGNPEIYKKYKKEKIIKKIKDYWISLMYFHYYWDILFSKMLGADFNKINSLQGIDPVLTSINSYVMLNNNFDWMYPETKKDIEIQNQAISLGIKRILNKDMFERDKLDTNRIKDLEFDVELDGEVVKKAKKPKKEKKDKPEKADKPTVLIDDKSFLF